MNSLRVRALRGVRLFVPLLVASVTYAAPPLAAAQSKAWSGECVGTAGTNAEGVATIQGLECLLANVLSVFIAMIGLAAFIMIVIGSFRYLVSGGNTKGTETARNTISYAVFGIVVALSAFIIVNLLAAFTGIDELTVLRIPRANEFFMLNTNSGR